jgi:hypothetical protein
LYVSFLVCLLRVYSFPSLLILGLINILFVEKYKLWILNAYLFSLFYYLLFPRSKYPRQNIVIWLPQYVITLYFVINFSLLFWHGYLD